MKLNFKQTIKKIDNCRNSTHQSNIQEKFEPLSN